MLSVLTAYSFITHKSRGHGLDQLSTTIVARKAETKECRDVNFAQDQCAFVRKYCLDEDAGLLPYLDLYYCHLGNIQPLAFIILSGWLGMLFTTIGIAASDFFSVNLSTIATILGLSESLAGVTFLAFGNGSPDVFSTFAAMGSNSASMAVGELLGAACFITAIVAGSMSLVREFRVPRKSYVRDICFFIVAVIFTTLFLLDGHLYFWECLAMIGYYALYVFTVVGSHWYSQRRKGKLRREGEARSHYYGTFEGRSTDELAGAPYRDDPDDHESTRRASHTDISALEHGPRIEIDGQEADVPEDGDDESEDHERVVAAEVSRGMRILRRPSGRRNTTMVPIRPSLVGALEFRSAIAQLQRESNLPLSSIPGRSRSENHLHPRTRRVTMTALDATAPVGMHGEHHTNRERSRSTCAHQMPNSAPDDKLYSDSAVDTGSRGVSRSSSTAHVVGGNLAPPPLHLPPPVVSATSQISGQRPRLYLETPSRCSSCTDLSSPAAEFPAYTDSPLLLTPTPIQARAPSFPPTPAAGRRDASLSVAVEPGLGPRPIRWWPYSILPQPHILLATLFPTLQGWVDKTYWDKFLSVISVPSIFMLVITLPVVEPESSNGSSVADTFVSYSIQTGEVSPSATPATQTLPLDREETMVAAGADFPLSKTISNAASDDNITTGWNRWLVCVQVFAGPLFAVVILWANMRDEWENAGRALVRMVLYTLLGSLILLATLLLTTTEHARPKYHALFCFLGFVISIAWISTVAGEVVGVLKTFGVILDISEALLGLTIFAAGNSIGDLVANITIARLGYPVMALSACFGGPLLNILLGIGIGGVIMMVQDANLKHRQHPELPLQYGPYPIKVGVTLIISSITLLVILVGLLIAVPMNKWILGRKIGWTLIAAWTLSTALNVVVEVTGVWQRSK